MSFCELRNNPSRATAVAMMFLAIGLSVLTVGAAWPHLSFLAGLGSRWNDFFRGMTFGFALTLETFAAIVAMAAVRARWLRPGAYSGFGNGVSAFPALKSSRPKERRPGRRLVRTQYFRNRCS